MKLLLFISSLLILSAACYSQNVRVFDTNQTPIENVIVIGDDFTSHTDKDGTLQYFPDHGTTKLSFLHPNFKRITLSWDELVAIQFQVKLHQRVRQLEEVTIRPLKRIQQLSEIPQQVAVITPNDALMYQPQTTADLLGASGEVFIQKSQMGGGSPMIRGFSANRIMLVVDGVRMNNAIFRSGNLHNVISLDATSLEQTEIIMGPGSVIYGSDALGGVIHFYTLKPRLSTSQVKTPIKALFRSSSANFEKTGHINFNLAGQKWASMTSISYSDFDHLKMGSWQHNDYRKQEFVLTTNHIDEIVSNPNPNEQIYSGYSQMNFIQKVRFRPSEFADFEYSFHYSRTSDIPRYDRLIQYNDANLKYAKWYYGPQQWLMHSLKAEININNELANTLTIIGAIQDYSESRYDRKFQNESLRVRKENIDIYSLNVDVDKYFSKTQTMYYGLEGIFNKIHSVGVEQNIFDQTETATSSRYPDGAEWWSLAAYAMYNQRLNLRTTLQAGVRYNFTGMNGTFDNTYYNFPFNDFSDSNGAISVNFGLVYSPTDELNIKGSVATGFRSPNIDDAAKVFDSEPGNVIIPNTQLEPEYASSFESGISWSPTEKLHIDLTVFYTRLYNAMVRRNTTLNGLDSIMYDGELSQVQSLTNTSWANLNGISSKAQYAFNNQFMIKATFNWQNGYDSDNQPMRHIAPIFGDTHLIYKKNRFTIDSYVIYNGEISFEKLSSDEREKTDMYAQDENGNPFSPAWWTINLHGSYNLSEKVNLNMGLENLMNVRYRPYSSGIVAPGFNASFSVSITL